MPTAERMLERKDGELFWLPPSATVLEAAQLMNRRHIGSILVLEGSELRGIFTERDVMRRVVAEQRDARTTRIGEVMTKDVIVASLRTSLDELRVVMREKRVRHVPVVDRNRVIGMISIGDLNEAEREVQVETIQYLSTYMSVA